LRKAREKRGRSAILGEKFIRIIIEGGDMK